jgi:steroid delta-isomerase-like uncharacterized protein
MNTSTQTLAERVIGAWNSKDKSVIFSLYTNDFIREDIGRNKEYDLKAMSHVLDLYWAAFPDMVFELEDQIESENKLVLVWKTQGTHKGFFMNIPPTNKRIQFNGISIIHLRKDKIFKVQYSWDEATMLRQMGLLPNLR